MIGLEKWRSLRLPYSILIVVVGLLAFWTMFDHFFILDDFLYLGAGSTGWIKPWNTHLGFYRPVGDSLWSFSYTLFGFQPLYYYLLAFAIHLINGYLLLRCGQRLFQNREIAFCAALLFVTFSVANEAVFWISSNLAEALYTAFLLSSLLFFLRFWDNGMPSDLLVSLSLFTLSLFSHEAAIVGPVLILLTGWMLQAGLKRALRRSLPHAAVASVFVVARIVPFLGGSYARLYGVGPHVIVNLLSYLASLATLGSLTTYLRYSGNYQPVVQLVRGFTPIAVILSIPLTLSAIFLLRRADRATWYTILWMLVALVPFVPYFVLQIRYMYAATIGLALLISKMIAPAMISRDGLKNLARNWRVVLVLAIAVFGVVTNNLGSSYYGKMGTVYQNIIQDIRPTGGKFPKNSVLIFLDLPRLTGGDTLPEVDVAVRLYYGQSLTVLTIGSDALHDTLTNYQNKPIFVFKFDAASLHVKQISP